MSIFRHTQQFQQVVLARGCVCARVLTHLHEDETWLIQMKAFLSPLPLVVGSSAESRGLDSTLGAAPIRVCSGIISKARCPVGRNVQKKVILHDVTADTIAVWQSMTNPYSRITSRPMRNGVDSFDTTLFKFLAGTQRAVSTRSCLPLPFCHQRT